MFRLVGGSCGTPPPASRRSSLVSILDRVLRCDTGPNLLHKVLHEIQGSQDSVIRPVMGYFVKLYYVRAISF